MPRPGVVESISVYFSTSAALSLVGSTVTLTAQLYESTTPDDIFTPIPGASVALSPPLTGALAIGTTSIGNITGLSITEPAGIRLLLVISAAVTAGVDIATTVSGYVSAGVGIN